MIYRYLMRGSITAYKISAARLHERNIIENISARPVIRGKSVFRPGKYGLYDYRSG
jgi:hypothetical protein